MDDAFEATDVGMVELGFKEERETGDEACYVNVVYWEMCKAQETVCRYKHHQGKYLHQTSPMVILPPSHERFLIPHRSVPLDVRG